MTSVPMVRVLTPHDVVHANCFLLSRPRNSMFAALAKFCPRKCEVPAWIAFRSCTIASTVNGVQRARETFALASSRRGLPE